MSSTLDTLQQAVGLLLSFDYKVWSIILVSFTVSAKALGLCLIPAISAGFVLAQGRFPGRHTLIALFQTLQAIPTVVVGLMVYLLLFRQGPMGDLRWLFTQNAMVMGQILLATPVLVSTSYAAFAGGDWRAWETARTLGASKLRAFLTLCHELRVPLMVAIIAAFSRIITEVGSSMLVGGNIQNLTRNMPTAIALETSKGEFAQAAALGMVLVLLALLLNFSLSALRGKQEHRHRG
ncbi:ABC transporter permease subunit [Ferrimonas sediminicola]|uniref:ABC transporter permease subunit n=1 Tax=Ferrimonas sediminicola TaxID=2569538 RepID=A0A4U1BIN8_9GAMM|nr:ABC transporter permease [Ferrimonas sediminicola]TKB50992.1 ABC transporter permease subunit [Ferrimonas sediminicola]